MFRKNNFSSSGGLYKQVTVFCHAGIILKLYELSRYRLSSYTLLIMNNYFPKRVEDNLIETNY